MRRSTLLLILLCAATFFAGLGRPAIGDSDEAFYAEAGREMVASGDWLTPYYNYETRFQKPILFYWLVSATYQVAGVSEAAARFWSAMAGLGLALVAASAGRRWRDDATGVLAGAIVATSFGYFSIGRLSLPDLPLAFFITLTIWAALRGSVDDRPRAAGWLALAGAAAGCGFLTKGPVGLILPGLVVAPIWWIERDRLRLPPAGLAAGALLAAAIGLPWYAAMYLTHGTAYLEGFFLGDNLERFATARFNDPRPVWFYLPILLGGMLPWTPLAAVAMPAMREAVKRRSLGDAVALRCALWALLPLAFYTASIGKQPRYILPVLPPLALLLADVLRRRLARTGGGRDRILTAAAVCVGLLLAALAALIWRARPLMPMVDPGLVTVGAVLILAGALVALAAAWRAPASQLPLAVTLAGALTLVGLQYGLSPAGRDPVQDMATLVLQHRQPGDRIATHRVFVRNLIFYTGLKQEDLVDQAAVVDFLRSPQRVLCVIGSDELLRAEAAGGFTARRLGEVLYFNASAVKLRTLIDPDQERDLERVLLVTNE